MKSLLKMFGMFLVIAMFLAPVQGAVMADEGDIPPKPEYEKEPLPEEIREMFAGGMDIETFLDMHRGPIPNALLELTDRPIPVIVKTAGTPLAEYVYKTVGRADGMAPMAQQAYVQDLLNAQAPLVASAEALGGTLMSQYTKVFNGFQVLLPANQLDALRAQPGVEYAVQAKQYQPALVNSVPLINADDLWTYGTGYEGAGITIAVIDSGIDYYHAALGGAGNPSDYSGDDHTVIETGTFPTAKVIGGTDFAGTDYNASDPANNVPAPDPDPVDEMGHGTHVASIAAGQAAGSMVVKGVAPQASLLAVKIFGACSTCTTTLTLDGIEYAMDPNGDGVMNDHVDVINMSLGSSFGVYDPVMDPELVAVENAVDMGIVVAAAAGNAGDTEYIVGAPSISTSAISVAGSTTGMTYGPTVEVDTGPNAGDVFIYYPADFDAPSPGFDTDLQAILVDVDAYDGGSLVGTFCDGETTLTPATALNGKIALISRGGCNFDEKVENAADAGALAALIYNNAPGAFTMIGDPVSIPAGLVTQADGTALQGEDGQTITIHAEDNVSMLPAPEPPDSVYPASSRGPRGYDSHLKPEIAAPGMHIFAAEMGSGTGGVSYSGTSMATPHIAGVAALLMEAKPTWTPEMIKAAMMNTAVDLNFFGPPIVPRQGAGRVDALAAVETEMLAVGVEGLVSVSFGYQELHNVITNLVQPITLTNLTGSDITVNFGAAFSSGPPPSGMNFIGLPNNLTVPGNSSITVDITLQINGQTIPPWWQEIFGYLFITETSPGVDIRLPFYVVPRPVANLTIDSVNNVLVPASGMGGIAVTNTGPSNSDLWAFPLLDADPNEAGQIDSGDLRLFGMENGGANLFTPNVDDIAVFFSAWDDTYLPQPFYVEYDLYMDVDEDGTDDWVAFNYDLGAGMAGAYDNGWLVFQVDLATGTLDIGSDYLIFTDFYSNFQFWYLPDAYYGLDLDSPENTDFDYQVFAFDMMGNVDEGEAGTMDYSDFSLMWWFTDNVPWFSPGTLLFSVWNQTLYEKTDVDGIILIDYHAPPGTAQAYHWPIFQNPLYLPNVWND